MSLKAVIFDWDGTLLNSAWPIMHAYKKALERHGFPAPDEVHLQQAVGRYPEFGFQILQPDLTTDQLEKLCRDYQQIVKEAGHQTRLFQGVPAMLNALREKNLKLAVATNMKKIHLEYFMEKLGVEEYFACCRTADITSPKPDPLMLEEILAELDLQHDDVVMVGDSDVDILMSREAGLRSIGVMFDGRQSNSMTSRNPDYQVRSVEELQKLVLSLAQ